MEFADVLVIVIGTILTLLALIAAVFIVLEVTQLVRELTQPEHDSLLAGQRKTSGGGLSLSATGQTGPLEWGGNLKRGKRVPIEAVEDPDMVRQMIRHFEGGADSGDKD